MKLSTRSKFASTDTKVKSKWSDSTAINVGSRRVHDVPPQTGPSSLSPSKAAMAQLDKKPMTATSALESERDALTETTRKATFEK